MLARIVARITLHAISAPDPNQSRQCLTSYSSRPCKRCVAVNEQHLCTDAPKRTKTKRPSNSRNLSSTQSSSCVSDGEGSSDEDRSDSSTHAHTHTHAPSRRRVSPPSATRSNPSAFLADPDVALNDDTDYLPSLYLVEFARRAALELAPSS